MKITVVTISFNQAQFLEACLDSVLIQDGPWEHIIVDPGSTDGSRAIIEAHRDQFSHVILEPDNGPADGLNHGFRQADGELYYYLNSDDILLPGAFAQVRKLFSASPEIDVISGGGYVIDEFDKRGRRLWSDPISRFGLAHGGSLLVQPSTFFRRAAFEKAGGFNPKNRSNWDGELVIDMFETGARFRQFKSAWSGYRLHSDSITGSASLDDRIQAYSRRMYARLIGKEPGRMARAISQAYRIRRILRHPSIIFQRLLYGRVYGGSQN